MKTEAIIRRQQRGFGSIGTPDGTHRVWLQRPTASGRICAACNFALAGHMNLVDAIDLLGYVSVDAAVSYDNDYSCLTLSCILAPEGCLEKLMDDIPKLMEEFL